MILKKRSGYNKKSKCEPSSKKAAVQHVTKNKNKHPIHSRFLRAQTHFSFKKNHAALSQTRFFISLFLFCSQHHLLLTLSENYSLTLFLTHDENRRNKNLCMQLLREVQTSKFSFLIFVSFNATRYLTFRLGEITKKIVNFTAC